jgi:deoxyribodipyrimidine photo-lyase
MVQIVWFKRDLRVTDHQPLADAAARGAVIPLYIVEPEYWRQPDVSRRQWLAIAAALGELAEDLAARDAPLVIRSGDAVAVLRDLHDRYRVTAIHAHEETGNAFTFDRDKAVRRFASDVGIAFHETPQFGVVRPLRNRNDWARLHRSFIAKPLVAAPTRISGVGDVPSQPIPTPEELGLRPDGCERPQPGTRASALKLLDSFVAGRGADYRKAMSRPLEGAKACSRLSVPLSTGAISMRETIQRALGARQELARMDQRERPVPLTAIDSLVGRLHWHCHFIQKLESEPQLEWRSQHPLHEAARHATAFDDPTLEAWANGRTGFPFLDACMRSLITTGWLNFRMRAMVMACASYHLDLDWHASGTRLARLFTDYEPGIHWPQVQMQSGQTGINTPRIYNPLKQSIDQDPDGHFIRRWCPELAALPTLALHAPWKADRETLKAAGVVLGETYPVRLVDHEEAARAARARITAIRRSSGYQSAAREVYAKHGSRKRTIRNDNPAQAARRAAKKASAKVQLALDI